jgi:CubicO group peptidase (beta-lactamase class C family)
LHGIISRRDFIRDGTRIGAGAVLVPALPQLSIRTRSSRSIPSGPEDLRQLERLVPELMSQGAVPGASIAIIKNATVVWHRGFGVRDASSHAPVDDDTVFEAASVSKTVFAYAIMQLVDRGTLSLDRPLTDYTSERVLEDDARLNLITARHVLSHTSGFPNFRTRAEPLRIHFTPGERFEYSGEGYWYLQSIVTSRRGGQAASVEPADSDGRCALRGDGRAAHDGARLRQLPHRNPRAARASAVQTDEPHSSGYASAARESR